MLTSTIPYYHIPNHYPSIISNNGRRKAFITTLKLVYFTFSARGAIKLEERCVPFEEQAKEKSEGKRRWGGIPGLFIVNKDGNEIVNTM